MKAGGDVERKVSTVRILLAKLSRKVPGYVLLGTTASVAE